VEDPPILDEQINNLLKEFSRRNVENHFRNYIYALDEEGVITSLVRRARELGPAGIQNLRLILQPDNKFDLNFTEGASRALAELEDGESLALVVNQAARVWDNCKDIGEIGGGGTFASFLEAARKLILVAQKNGPLPEGVIKALTIFVQHISDWRAYYSVFETAASTRSPKLREELIKIITATLGHDWNRRAEALFALRHYPEMKATMLEAINHPEEKISTKAAKALVEMLGIIPGCGEKDFVRWKTWAMQRVPPELRVKPPSRLEVLFNREPKLDKRQARFWNACSRKHQETFRTM